MGNITRWNGWYCIVIWLILHVGTHGSCVRSSRIEGIYAGLLERTHEPYVPTFTWAILSFNPIENQQLTPCIRNSPILYTEISGFAFKSGWKRRKTAMGYARNGRISAFWFLFCCFTRCSFLMNKIYKTIVRPCLNADRLLLPCGTIFAKRHEKTGATSLFSRPITLTLQDTGY